MFGVWEVGYSFPSLLLISLTQPGRSFPLLLPVPRSPGQDPWTHSTEYLNRAELGFRPSPTVGSGELG